MSNIILDAEAGRLVSGHGLSRAAGNAHSEGFSPCPLAGAKAHQHHSVTARLKPCPDTRPVFLGPTLCKCSFAEVDFGIQDYCIAEIGWRTRLPHIEGMN